MSAYRVAQLLHEGKAKRVYGTDREEVVAIEYKDDATAFNARKRAQLAGKGAINCRISALIFEHLEACGIPTHFLGVDGSNWMLARSVRVVPLEVVLRNLAAGSLCSQLPIASGTVLDPPLLDLYYKDDGLGDPLLSEARLALLGLVDAAQRQLLEQLARRINDELIQLFGRCDLQLVDIKFEFGLTSQGELVLADEISPDSCRLWDRSIDDSKDRILDKDRFRQDLGGVLAAYGEVLKRVQHHCPEPRIYR